MKTVLPALMLCMMFTLVAKTQSTKDLPAPSSNLVTLATGSYVIPMDNNLQLNTSGNFNLKSYGLIVHLLNNNVRVKWAIKAGKAKDAADFTGTAQRILPSTVAFPSLYNFLAGPFVIYAADTTGVAAIVNSFYTANALTGNDRPSIYRLTVASLNVDIRYDLTGFKPKAAILNDGGNALIHTTYLSNASVPSANYRIAYATDLLSKCYTFASEPHADVASIGPEKLRAVKAFVTYGGNFLAQCEAVLSYENQSGGLFQSTIGFEKVNGNIASSAVTYPNADLSYSQFQGEFSIAQGGSVRNWQLMPLSSFKNNTHQHSNNNATGNLPIGASVAKMNAANKAGGLVFYIGNHEFSSVSTITSINGIRMYLNAFLTPVSLNLNCNIGEALLNVLPLKIADFILTTKDGYATLNWLTESNSKATHFIIERSTDGNTFIQAGIVFSSDNATPYQFKDDVALVAGRVTYYRIRSEDVTSKFEYSVTKSIKAGGNNKVMSITTYPNPATNQLNIQLPMDWNNKPVTIEIINAFGQVVFSESRKATGSVSVMDVQKLTPGYYFIKAKCKGELAKQGLLKR